MAMLILLAMAVTSCRSVRYVPVETVKHDSVYVGKVVRDSVFVKDSVLVVKGDTVTEYRWKYVLQAIFIVKRSLFMKIIRSKNI